MKNEGALFDLVKSLTKSEKRFIKIYASCFSPKESNGYLALFNAFDKSVKYNEAKLGKKMSGSTQDLRGIKGYLYTLILDCLDFYHRDSSSSSSASKYIHVARILSAKRLDSQSDKIISKAWKLSKEFDRYENLVTLNDLRKSHEFKRETITHEKIGSYRSENIRAIEEMRLKQEYWALYSELLNMRLLEGAMSDHLDNELLKSICKNPYFDVLPVNASFEVNMYFLLSKIEYCRIVSDTIHSSSYIRKLLSLFEKNEIRISDNVEYYVLALNSFIGGVVYGESRSEADAILKKLNTLPSLLGDNIVSRDLKIYIFQVYYVLATHIAIVFKDYESGIPYIEQYEKEKRLVEKYFIPSYQLSLQANFACVYFGAGKFKEALKHCNSVLSSAIKVRYDVLYEVRILLLMVHYELRNQIILPSLIRGTRASLKKMNKENHFTALFLKYLHLLLDVESKKDKKIIFTEFKEKLLPLLNPKSGNTILDNVDMIAWLDRKIENPL